MGQGSSNFSELEKNPNLKRLTNNEKICPNDPFWNQLLSFTFVPPTKSSDYKLLEEQTFMLLKNLAIYNLKTGNFPALITVFQTRVKELKKILLADGSFNEENPLVQQCFNALFIIRSCFHFFIENLSEDLMLDQLSPIPDGEDTQLYDPNLLELFIEEVVEVITELPNTKWTYCLHWECVTTLLTLLSTQLYRVVPAENLKLFHAILGGACAVHASKLVKRLMESFISQECAPPMLQRSSSLLYDATTSLASGLMRVVTLGYSKGIPSEEPPKLLANQSLLLLLVLSNHCANSQTLKNPYRHILLNCVNTVDLSSSLVDSEASHQSDHCAVNFNELYSVFCEHVDDEPITLLLYLMMHKNSQFRIYLMSKTDIQKLTVPLLRVLYKSPNESSHHIYMALIVILMFTEDDEFNKTVHNIQIKNIDWLTNHPVNSMSLGSLIVLVLTRTIIYNLQNLKDRYLHTNCLAALANMSARFNNIHSSVSQKLVGLVPHLAKKHAKTVEKIRQAASAFKGDSQAEAIEQQYLQDLNVLEEVIRMVLEILNSVLTHCLAYNNYIVYNILYEKESFHVFKTHPAFQDVLQNVDKVVNFFNVKLSKCWPQGQVTEHQVMVVIQTCSVQLVRLNTLKNFPELKFKYVEEESPDEFFIPYIWSLVYQRSNLYCSPKKIVLFRIPNINDNQSLNGDEDSSGTTISGQNESEHIPEAKTASTSSAIENASNPTA